HAEGLADDSDPPRPPGPVGRRDATCLVDDDSAWPFPTGAARWDPRGTAVWPAEWDRRPATRVPATAGDPATTGHPPTALRSAPTRDWRGARDRRRHRWDRRRGDAMAVRAMRHGAGDGTAAAGSDRLPALPGDERTAGHTPLPSRRYCTTAG